MSDEKLVKLIAGFMTEDPDIFNEMAISTSGIAIGMGNPVVNKTKQKKKKSRKKKKKRISREEGGDYEVDQTTGQPKNGEILSEK